jgi:PAS domain S-box-containing protein
MLTQSEKQFERIIQNLDAAVYVCDATGYLKLYNKAAATLWGRVPEIGKDLYCGAYQLVNKDGDELPVQEHPLALAIKTESKTINNVEIIIKRPDGSYRRLLQSSNPVFNANGEFAGAVNMLTELTENKEKIK